jgi:hypothetical protein
MSEKTSRKVIYNLKAYLECLVSEYKLLTWIHYLGKLMISDTPLIAYNHLVREVMELEIDASNLYLQ